MKTRTPIAIIAAIVWTAGSIACGSSDTGTQSNGSKADPGSEGGACYPNSTCNAGLACLSNICVNPGTGGAAGSDASTGASGGSGGNGGTAGFGTDSGAADADLDSAHPDALIDAVSDVSNDMGTADADLDSESVADVLSDVPEDVPDGAAIDGAADALGDAADGHDGESDACVPSNGGVELCDGEDNNCDGFFDESFDLSEDPENCGVCGHDCTFLVKNVNQAFCTATAGSPGVCSSSTCATDYFDFNQDPADGCETYCFKQGDSDPTCDGVDDDCDGLTDEDVDFCTDPENCGTCGRSCGSGANAVFSCAVVASGSNCTESNTQCEFFCAPGWIDANGVAKDGCEYSCRTTKRTDINDPSTLVQCDKATDPDCGVREYCDDSIDNDCDGQIDSTDLDLLNPTSGDPDLNQPCFGGVKGECAKPYHQGITHCIAGQIKCGDDNSGTTTCTDDSECKDPATPFCVASPERPKKVCGTKFLRAHSEPELCDALDNDCNGEIDNNPTDVRVLCGSSTAPCTRGILICSSGELKCLGDGVYQPRGEVCNGEDDNCDGNIDEGLSNLVCGTDEGECETGTGICLSGVIKCDCEKGPVPEICNGRDDDCDGTIDNGIPIGTPCIPDHDEALYPGARDKGRCSTGSGVSGCGPSGEIMCLGGLQPAPEVCDGLDNDCDGQVDELGPAPDGLDGTMGIGTVCGSATGACTQGVLACSYGKVVCTGSGPEPEVCDCLDNDCDGLVDEDPVPGSSEPPVCFGSRACAFYEGSCQCATLCDAEPFPCPTGGYECVDAERSGSDPAIGLGKRCIITQ